MMMNIKTSLLFDVVKNLNKVSPAEYKAIMMRDKLFAPPVN